MPFCFRQKQQSPDVETTGLLINDSTYNNIKKRKLFLAPNRIQFRFHKFH